MLVPFHLERRSAAAADALLLPSGESALELCALLGHDPPPKMLATADGILLLLDHPAVRAVAGAIKLRRLSDHLLVPFDAELIPQLHADEMAALTKTRGFVILPGGRALEFQPDAMLDWDALLAVGTVRREAWEPFPQPRRIAEELRSIHLALPRPDPEDVVSAGGSGIGVETPRPPESGLGDRAAGRTGLAIGRALSDLGRAIGLQGLQQWGRRLIERAMQRAPRLREEVFGKRESALHELLRRFQEGDIEGALRRALPFADGQSHRGEIPSGSDLPTNDLRYSLRNILPGSGPVAVWNGHDNKLWLELQTAYRKSAQAAIDAGDFRRAAFIYGKLLADWRSAAEVLARGGLHGDAAILFRDKIGDKLRAAREFAEDGAFEEALAIYEEQNAHEMAGDLLRRIGDEEAAVEKYRIVASAMLAKDPLGAGEFILAKANRIDLAEIYFKFGSTTLVKCGQDEIAVPCAIRLARIYADGDPPEQFFSLLKQGEMHLGRRGNANAAGMFFNEFASLATRPKIASRRDEVRDRCILALAGKLRDHAAIETKPGEIVPALFGTTGNWEPAAVRDAAFALKSAQSKGKPSEPAKSIVTWLNLAAETVTAAAFAAESGDLYVGFADGQLICFNPKTESKKNFAGEVRTVHALAVHRDGRHFVAAQRSADEPVVLTSYLRRDGQPTHRAGSYQTHFQSIRMSPTIETDLNDSLLVIREMDSESEIIPLRNAALWSALALSQPFHDSLFEILLPSGGSESFADLFLFFGDVLRSISRMSHRKPRILQCALSWYPHVCTLPGSLPVPPVTWLHMPGVRVEFAGIGSENSISIARIDLTHDTMKCGNLLSASHPDGFRCVALIRSGVIAAVTGRNWIRWMKEDRERLIGFANPVELGRASPAVACYYVDSTRELLVLLADGALARVAIPT